jgi:hypothetical protein
MDWSFFDAKEELEKTKYSYLMGSLSSSTTG